MPTLDELRKIAKTLHQQTANKITIDGEEYWPIDEKQDAPPIVHKGDEHR